MVGEQMENIENQLSELWYMIRDLQNEVKELRKELKDAKRV